MGYVTSVELFMDLKPRIYEVCHKSMLLSKIFHIMNQCELSTVVSILLASTS